MEWKCTKHEGVRYREHPTRKNGPHPDRYYVLRYRDADKKRHEEGLGWASQKMTADKARGILIELQENIRLGQGWQSVAERREMLKAERKAEAERIEQAVTFGYVARLFLEWSKNNKKSWRDDRQRVNKHILPVLEHLLLDDITYATIEALKNDLQNKEFVSPKMKVTRRLAPQTIIHCLGLVREIFNYALSCDRPGTHKPIWEGVNPAVFTRKFGRGIKAPKNNNRRMRILGDKEVDLLFAALRAWGEETPKDKRKWIKALHDIVAISLDTGLRLSEILQLRWSCVNLERQEIRLLETKGGRSRTVYFTGICPKALEAITERASLGMNGPIFPPRTNSKSKTQGHDSISSNFREACEKAGLNDGFDDRRLRAVFHTLRHTHATRMLERGVDIYILQQLMGHRDLATTERYLHLCDRVKREEALRAGGNSVTPQHQSPQSLCVQDTPAAMQ